jgi:hypothetical protein
LAAHVFLEAHVTKTAVTLVDQGLVLKKEVEEGMEEGKEVVQSELNGEDNNLLGFHPRLPTHQINH